MFILKSQIRKVDLLAYFVGALGTIWVIFDGKVESMIKLHFNHGDLIFFIAVLVAGVYLVLLKCISKLENALVMTFLYSPRRDFLNDSELDCF